MSDEVTSALTDIADQLRLINTKLEVQNELLASVAPKDPDPAEQKPVLDQAL